ncbi:sensor histidine kinase [Rhizomonospora bruguierae]|uniref:sensor histidine kinase n=1 Tax=Rhizomonospora bruguierae TaxID=1581705 RepID=UPI001BCCA09C|nr:sensor histidine kinase [Micromonospora sp. NBRC 107566]
MTAVTGELTPFVHEALLYRDAEDYLAGTVPFISDALAAAEPVLVAVPGENLTLLREALGAAAGGITFMDMAEVGRNPGRILPWVMHAFMDERQHQRVRVVGEPVYVGRTDAEYRACVQHEAMVNVAFADRQALMLCPYDAFRLPAAALADAASTHPLVRRGADRASSRAYADPDQVVAAFNVPLAEGPAAEELITFDAARLGEVRRAVVRLAREAGLVGERVTDLQLAVNEVATNAVVHTSGPGTLRIWREPRELVCEIRDHGRLADRRAGRTPVDVYDGSGRGLLIVHELCDLVEIHTGEAGTTIRLHMRL